MDFIKPPDCGPPPPAAVYPDISTAFTAHMQKPMGTRFSPGTLSLLGVVYACDREGKGDSRVPSLQGSRNAPRVPIQICAIVQGY